MREELLTNYTALSPKECQRRITMAAGQGAAEILGYALSSQANVIDNGNGFEVQSKGGPAVLIGTVSPNTTGSVVHARIKVPAQRFYRIASCLVILVSACVAGGSIYDLVFGTHLLLVRSRTELWGHPASIEEHFSVFFLLPIVAIPLLAILWPKARPIDAETVQTFREFIKRLFEAEQSITEQND